MIQDKYKLCDVARDLNLQVSEVTELLEKHFPGEKKKTTILTGEELNLVFENYTQKSQLSDMNVYYASKEKSPGMPKAEEKKKAPAKKSSPKKTAEKKSSEEVKPEPKPETPKAEPKPEVKPEPPKAEPKPEAKPEPSKAEPKPEAKPEPPKAEPEEQGKGQDTGRDIHEDKEIENMNDTPKPQGERRYNNDRPQGDRPQGERRYNNDNRGDRPQGERRYNNDRPQGDRPRYNNDRPQGERRYNNDRPQGDRPQGERRYNNDRPQGDRPRYNNDRPQGERHYNNDRPQGERHYNNDRPQGDRPRYNNDRPQGERRYNNDRPQGDRPQGDRRYNNDRPQGDRPRYNNDRPQGERHYNNDRPQGERHYNNDRPQGDRPRYNNDRPQGERRYNNDRPQGDRPQGDRPRYNNDRPRYNNDNRGERRYNNDRPQQAHQQKPAKPAPAPVPRKASSINPELDENVNGKMIRHVDMRAANVDLDKYNERYEQIAPENLSKRGDDSLKKQKIGGKNKKKNFMSKKDKEMEKLKRLEMERERRQKLHITLPDEISVGDLALKLKIQSAEIIKRLMGLGEMKSVSDIIDYDTAALVAMDIGAKVEHEVVVTIEERLFDEGEDDDTAKVERPPVVVVMGHVDHGKTSILDAIRNSEVTSTEAGGITQHIGAYQVNVNGKPVTFLDTPGHEAFTAMRARGADITDIAILVVAGDDGIMPQTVESINHAKAAGVSIIVAINKMDKPTANAEKVKQELTEHGLVPEEWGGDVICVPVSAKTKMGIQDLLENVQLVAEVKELKANPDRMAKGTVIEAKLDKGRGPVATILIQNGTLRTGDSVIAGQAIGRVRVMTNSKGERIDEAGPSTPVEITGLAEVPAAGDEFNAVEDEKLAKELVEKRRQEAKEREFSSYQKVTLDNLFEQIEVGETKELPLIVKADVQGSVEAVKQSLEKLSNPEVRVKVIHGAVGAVSKSDVMLAQACGAIIVGFNVRPDPIARDMAETEGVDMRMYRVIYDAIEEISSAMKGMLAPKTREVELGRAEVRDVFKITGVGTVAGCYVLEGKITRNAEIRIVRDGIIIADEHLTSLKRFKDDVKEVAKGYECGMGIEKFGDLKVGDIFEAYMIEEYRD